MPKQSITYYYRGMIERGPFYAWKEGYSENSAEGLPLYPWSTKAECRREAKSKGAKAVFVRDDAYRIALGD